MDGTKPKRHSRVKPEIVTPDDGVSVPPLDMTKKPTIPVLGITPPDTPKEAPTPTSLATIPKIEKDKLDKKKSSEEKRNEYRKSGGLHEHKVKVLDEKKKHDKPENEITHDKLQSSKSSDEKKKPDVSPEAKRAALKVDKQRSSKNIEGKSSQGKMKELKVLEDTRRPGRTSMEKGRESPRDGDQEGEKRKGASRSPQPKRVQPEQHDNDKEPKKDTKGKKEVDDDDSSPSIANDSESEIMEEISQVKTDPGDTPAPRVKPKTRGGRTQSALMSGFHMFGFLAPSRKPASPAGDADKRKKRTEAHYVAPTMKDLPARALSLIAESKIKKKDLEPYFYELLMVLSFVTKDSFRMDPDVRIVQRSEKTRYASREMQEKAAAAMIPATEKDMKKRFKHIEFSAKGGFGRVFSAKVSTSSGVVTVAIKRLPNTAEKDIRSNLCELAFLLHCTNHSNIVNYKECWKMEDEIWIVTEFLEGGTLDFASRVHRFREKHLAFIAGEILNGLVYLHEQNFAHRDLKPSNVMMSVHGEIKIIDFGLCCDFHSGPRQQTLGSPFWIPPEMLLRKQHTTAVDIWSFSILLLELVLGRIPHQHSRLASMMFSIMGLTLTEALKDPYHRCLKDPSKELLSFLTSAVISDPAKRRTAKELLQDPWLKGHKESKEGIEKVLHAVFISNSLQQHGMV